MRSFIIALSVLSTLFIASCGKEGEHSPSAVKEEHTPAADNKISLKAPSGVSTLSRDGQITLNWNRVEGATSYNVYFSNSTNITTSSGTKIGRISETSYVHTGLKNNSMYYYIVTAINDIEESLPSDEMGARPNAAPPAVPTGVGASGGDGKITVRWTAVPGAESYNIYSATVPGAARVKKGKNISGIKTTSYQDMNVKKKTMYYYVVTAVNDGGESPASGETGAMP